MSSSGHNPRAEATERLGGRYEARVLEDVDPDQQALGVDPDAAGLLGDWYGFRARFAALAR